MYSPEFILNLSILVSEILNRIGASQFIRGLRRYYCNQEEWLDRMIYRDVPVELYVLGSRIEGTTTEGMESDRDVLECYTDIELIQSPNEAKCDVFTFYGHIFDDEKTHPGYVKLHLYAHDLPLTTEHLEFLRTNDTIDFYRNIVVENGKLLLRNQYGKMKYSCDETNGPARTDIFNTSRYYTTLDRVFALNCQTWPRQAENWFLKKTRRNWPSAKVQELIRSFGCFITPVGHVDSEVRTVEWRLSLSKAERLLIWSLNETQFKCIVLMKLITKEFIKTKFPESITSYHCKNIVFSVIECTDENIWQPKNIGICIHMCLLRLLHFVERLNIPQFFIPENNLLKHKLSREDSFKVAQIIRDMIKHRDYRFFLCIQIDNFGDMIYNCLTGAGKAVAIRIQKKLKLLLCALALPIIGQFSHWRLNMLGKKLAEKGRSNHQERLISVIKAHFRLLSNLQKSVVEFRRMPFNTHKNAANWMDMMTSHICVSLGSNLLCFGVSGHTPKKDHERLFQMGFQYIREGYQHDSVSSGLKCSYILFKCGLFNEALCRLKFIKEKLLHPRKRSNIQACKCRDTTREVTDREVKILSSHSLDSLVGNVTTNCVFYLRTELTMTPKALVYEMFRSTGHEEERDIGHDFWMEHAVVDPTIMLFYLQFICFRELGDAENQEMALFGMLNEIVQNQNLGHFETALNILGHCFMEQGFYEAALICFVRSLNYDFRIDKDKFPAREDRNHVARLLDHNAAKWHLCVCLVHIFRNMELDSSLDERNCRQMMGCCFGK